MLKTIRIADLKPNPYRDLENYEIIRDKVEALKRSIAQTGFWGVIARPSGRYFEIAFGHHRLVALREMRTIETEIIVRDLTNEQMLQMMANENLEEWGHSIIVEMETIRATIRAFGRGEINLPAVPKSAPQVRRVDENPHLLYTKVTVAEFLDWTNKKEGKSQPLQPNFTCETAFQALDMVEQGIVTIADLKGLNRSQVAVLAKGKERIHEAHQQVATRFSNDAAKEKQKAEVAKSPTDKQRHEERARVLDAQATHHTKAAETKAAMFTQSAARDLHRGEGTVQIAQKALALEMTAPQEIRIHEIDDLADRISRQLEKFGDGTDAISKDFNLLKDNLRDLSDEAAEGLRQSLSSLVRRLTEWRDTIMTPTRSHFAGTQAGHRPKGITNGRSSHQ